MVTAHDSNYKELSKLTYDQNKVLYCQRHNYPLFVKTSGFRTGLAANFDKIYYILSVLENNTDIDWVWWLDTDALITNFNKTIEEFCDNQYHCVIGCETYNNQLTEEINNGSFFIKNTAQSHELLREIIKEEPNHLDHPWTDQGSMMTVLAKHQHFKDIIKCVNMRQFNSLEYSYWDAQGWINHSIPGRFENSQWYPGDFVMHWAGYPNDVRIKEIKRFLESKIVY